jgi:hypothetical protein
MALYGRTYAIPRSQGALHSQITSVV